MLPDRVSNPGPLTYESGALPIALRGPAYNKRKGRLRERQNFGELLVHDLEKILILLLHTKSYSSSKYNP